MANYYASARSNYFRVKNPEAFMEEMFNVPDITIHGDNEKGFCILVDGGDYGGWPSWALDEDDNEYEVDVPVLVSKHLMDDEVAIFMEAGAEKLRYVTGYAEAINSKGERTGINLFDIYELAAELTDKPENVTHCEY